jgi:hypothetical protein
MQQDLEDEKNKTIIQDLAEKVENHEANLKKKDVAIQDLEIMVKEHCWGPSASEGPQKHNLTMFLEYNE